MSRSTSHSTSRSTSPVNINLKSKTDFVKENKTSLVQQPHQQPSLPTLPQKSSFTESIKEGVGIGVGSAMANNVIHYLFSDKNKVTVSKDNNSDTKISHNKQQQEFNECMETNNDKYLCSNIYK